jgi:hypothetical protein
VVVRYTLTDLDELAGAVAAVAPGGSREGVTHVLQAW